MKKLIITSFILVLGIVLFLLLIYQSKLYRFFDIFMGEFTRNRLIRDLGVNSKLDVAFKWGYIALVATEVISYLSVTYHLVLGAWRGDRLND